MTEVPIEAEVTPGRGHMIEIQEDTLLLEPNPWVVII